ncbi:MAG: sulfite exporter TauE/SafE family protein, partial [Gemmatimonadota bacterium]
MSLIGFLLATTAVALGALIQGTIGFGLGLFAAPLLILIDPRLVPGPILVSSAVLTVLLARREWHSVQGNDLGWAVAGRVIGTAVAMGAISVLSNERLELLFGLIVLGAVGLTASGLRIYPAPRTLGLVGIVSGFMGTLTSIGGPPIALLYQHETGPRIRATLSVFFIVGVGLSLAGLAGVGRFGMIELKLGGYLIPGILVGYGV